MSRRILPGVLDSISRGYDISGSSRFDSDKSAYFSQNFKYNGNQKTWTFSTWIKLTDVSTYQCIFSQAGTPLLIGYTGGRFRVDLNGVGFFETTEYFRDIAGWYHYMLVFDTTQSTAANRAKIYINGVQSSITFTSWTPSQNTDYGINSAVEHRIGQYGASGYFLKAYLADTHFVDGQALSPSSFGEIDASTGSWKPKAYSGTYGRNGFYLKNFKKAIKFDGSTTYCDTGINAYSSTSTWSLWIKPTVSGGPLVNKVSYYAASTNDFPWQLNYNSNTGKIELLIDSGNDYTTDQTVQSTGSQNLIDGSWHHISVVTKSQSYVKIYIDGSLDTNSATSVNIASGSRNYFLGRDAYPYSGGSPGRFYNGSMYDVRYVPYELTLGEIQSIYNTTSLPELDGYLGSDSSTDTYYMSQITFNGSFAARKSTAPTNVADSKKGIISMWVDFTGGNGTVQNLWTARNNSVDGNAIDLYKAADNKLVFRAGTGDSVTYGSIVSASTLTSTSGLNHIAVAWDMASNKVQMYFNGISQGSASTTTDAKVDISASPYHGIGGYQFNPMTPNLQAKVGQVYVNYGEFLDLSVSTNLNKFYNNGTPISLGSCGEMPTGNIPTFLLDGVVITKNHGGGGDLDTTVGSYSVGGTITGATCSNRNGFKTYSVAKIAGIMGTVVKDSPTPVKFSENGYGGETAGNYCVWNPLDKTMSGTSTIFANSNLTVSEGTSLGSDGRASMIFQSGKWYFEARTDGVTSGSHLIGINIANEKRNSYSGIYRSSGDVYNLATTAVITTHPTYTTNDIIGVAFDVDSGKCWFRKNGTWLTGDPAAGTTPTFTFTAGTEIVPYYAFDNISGTKVWHTNFGQSEYYYSAPTGFKSMNTSNFVDPTIKKPKSYFDTALYTGNGVNAANALTISGYSFQPNFVWIKNRSGNIGHIQDSVSGLGNFLASDLTNAYGITGGGDISSLNSDGFTLSYQNARTNQASINYAAWMWKEAGQAGFDIVSYTGNGNSGRSISHNLASVPKFIMVKATSAVANWAIYHSDLINSTYDLKFTTAAQAQGYQFGTTPISTEFYVGGSGSLTNSTGVNYIAYVFSEIPGFSKFGKYIGNGDTNGPFVHLGFKPAWIMIKNISTSEQWAVYDYKRPLPPGNNNTGNFLPIQSSGGEDTNASYHQIDRLSNGFKIRGQQQELINFNGNNYIYMAFAENPYKYALAR